MPIFGIDVSHHQGPDLDWDRIRKFGIEFMFARASLATTPDEHYRKNLKRASDAGIPVVGAYHFLYPAKVVSPVAQAHLFLDQVKDPAGKLLMLDIERDGKAKARIEDARAFAEVVAKATGGHPLLMYAPAWYWGRIGNPPASDLGRLVASLYVPVKRTPEGRRIRMTPAEAYAKVGRGFWSANHGGWERAKILQFTSCGKVPGHRGRVDFNAYRGTLGGLVALTAKPVVGAPVVVDPLDVDVIPDNSPAQFHVVVDGDTLISIARQFGWEPSGSTPAFRAMLQAFPENEPFRAHPKLIHPGEKVRVA